MNEFFISHHTPQQACNIRNTHYKLDDFYAYRVCHIPSSFKCSSSLSLGCQSTGVVMSLAS